MEKRIVFLEDKLVKSDEDVKKSYSHISELQMKMDEYEQYSRRDNLVISGFTVTKAYNRAKQSSVKSNEDFTAEQMSQSNLEETETSERDNERMTNNITKFAKSKLNVDLTKEDIVTVHPLPKRNGNDSPLWDSRTGMLERKLCSPVNNSKGGKST